MNNLPPLAHGPPAVPPYPNRRQHEFHYQPPMHHPAPHHMPYNYHHPQHYQGPPYYAPYPQQWYPPPYQNFTPPMPRPYQQQSPLIVSSHPHAPPVMPMSRQPQHTPQPIPQTVHQIPPVSIRTPQPEQSTPSTASQAVASPATTPTSTSFDTSTPPVSSAKPPSISAAPLPAVRMPFYPKLPWFSVSESSFPQQPRRRRKRRTATISSQQLELPPKLPSETVEEADLEQTPSQATVVPVSANNETPTVIAAVEPEQPPPQTLALEPTAGLQDQATSQGHKRSATRPVVPIVPIFPTKSAVTPSPPKDKVDTTETVADPIAKDEDTNAPAKESDATTSAVTSKAPPKSWADLFSGKAGVLDQSTVMAASNSNTNGGLLQSSGTLADALRAYEAENDPKVSFIEPRGLVNTGNMCYMNSILQILVFCVPFYDFLDQVSKRAIHNFKSNTPLIESMIMFMREFNLIDSATSVEQLGMRLKNEELEQYGEAFIPEYVYEVIKRLPRFSTMRRGHQQDAEEFLGFLLEGLHDECALVMKNNATNALLLNIDDSASTADHVSLEGNVAGDGWLEVGPKQKAAVTRSSGNHAIETPITKIFGGKLRSEFNVPGLKKSVTLEPYQPLQLDIGDPNVNNITEALKGLTRSETIQGDFDSPRGPGVTAKKQVFIETLPPVLILHLKRFQYDNAGGTQKIWKKIGYPLELEIPKEVFPQHVRATMVQKGLPKYRLIGVVYHHGKSASGGHYTVDVRRQEGKEWIRLDDTVIKRIRSEDVAREGGEEDPKILAKALEEHKRNQSSGANIYKQAGFEENEDEEDNEKGWSQVNGSLTSPTSASSSQKKWSGVVNGSATPSTAGKQTPRENRSSVKDNKIAYILFYQRLKGTAQSL